jgi:hypothetical protein
MLEGDYTTKVQEKLATHFNQFEVIRHLVQAGRHPAKLDQSLWTLARQGWQLPCELRAFGTLADYEQI